MAGEQQGGQRAGVCAGVVYRHQIADVQRRAGEAVAQHVRAAAQVAHQLHRLRPALVAESGDGKRSLSGEQRLLGRQRAVTGGTAEHRLQGGLLKPVQTVFQDHIGRSPGDLFVHHRQEVRPRLGREEAPGLHQ